MRNLPRCQYVPAESGHCTNCGQYPYENECPKTGEVVGEEPAPSLWQAMLAPFTALGRFIGDLIEEAARDDRS